MSTFEAGNVGNVKQKQATVSKDAPTKEEITAAEKPQGTDEAELETEDRHVASSELPAKDVTDPDSQADTAVADDAGEKIVAGAAIGPDPAGVVRNDEGRVAYAPPGSHDAAMNGVQEDAAGHVDSVGTDNSSRSGVRI